MQWDQPCSHGKLVASKMALRFGEPQAEQQNRGAVVWLVKRQAPGHKATPPARLRPTALAGFGSGYFGQMPNSLKALIAPGW